MFLSKKKHALRAGFSLIFGGKCCIMNRKDLRKGERGPKSPHRFMPKNVLVVDGQGGRIGRALVERLAARSDPRRPAFVLTAVGSNAMATANMLKGAPGIRGATGENAVVVCARRADVIVGPVGIIIADAMLGEITPAMATAVSSASAVRVLVPMNRTQCENYIVGVRGDSLSALIDEAAEAVLRFVGDTAAKTGSESGGEEDDPS